jgi:hypothetical protein
VTEFPNLDYQFESQSMEHCHDAVDAGPALPVFQFDQEPATDTQETGCFIQRESGQFASLANDRAEIQRIAHVPMRWIL